jgi:cytoskeletal protein CcmA (bactofilin family)
MWKKEEPKNQPIPEPAQTSVTPAATSAPAAPSFRDLSASAPAAASRGAATISQGIRIKGEITGSEDLFIDGLVEGKLSLANGSVTVGPNGTVKADVSAREVIVRGKVEGKVAGRERVQLWGTATVNGEVLTDRLAIEDGAVLRGKVEAGKPVDRSAADRSAGAGPNGKTGNVSVGSGTATI